MTSELKVGDTTLDTDFLIDEVTHANGLTPSTDYTATLTDETGLLDSQQFTTLDDDPNPPEPVKPDVIPNGSLVITPDLTTALIEDTDRSVNRYGQHMYVSDGIGGTILFKNDSGDATQKITLTGLTEDTVYPSGAYGVGYILDEDENYVGDGLATNEFKTNKTPPKKPDPIPSGKLSIVPDITTAVITDTDTTIDRTGQHMYILDKNGSVVAENSIGDSSKSISLTDLAEKTTYPAGSYLVGWVDDENSLKSDGLETDSFTTKEKPEEKPLPIPKGMLTYTPDITSCLVEDTDTTIDRTGQHMFVTAGWFNLVVFENDKGDSSHTITLTGLTEKTKYAAGSYKIGWTTDKSGLKGDTIASDEFTTLASPRERPENIPPEDVTVTVDGTNATITDISNIIRNEQHLCALTADDDLVIEHSIGDNSKSVILSDLVPGAIYAEGAYKLLWIDDVDNTLKSDTTDVPEFSIEEEDTVLIDRDLVEGDGDLSYNSDYQFTEARVIYNSSYISAHQPTLKVERNGGMLLFSGSFNSNTGSHNGSSARNYAYTNKTDKGEISFSNSVVLIDMNTVEGFVKPTTKITTDNLDLLTFTNGKNPSDYGKATISIDTDGILKVNLYSTKATGGYYQVDGKITWSFSYTI